MYFQKLNCADVPAVLEESLKNNENSAKAPFIPPHDWPGPGPIDLELHDLPHDSSETEWWYVNGHLDCENGQQYSYFAAFFRTVAEIQNGNPHHAHSILWGIVDVQGQKYYSDSLLDMDTVDYLRKAIMNGSYNMDSHLTTALLEVLNKGHLPLPDRLATIPAIVQKSKLSLDYNGNTFCKDDQGHYHLFCTNVDKKIELDLHFAPKKHPIRQGNNGFTNISRNKEDIMFYYFIPRNDVTGNIIVDGTRLEISKGTGWYDHEFGGEISLNLKDSIEKNKEGSYAWNWFSCQLDDGTDVTATVLTNSMTGEVIQSFGLIVDPDSVRTEYLNMTFTGVESSTWSSPRTTNDYPQEWNLDIHAANFQLTAHSAFVGQEFVSILAKPGFWEGRMVAQGTYNGKTVTGLGFLERTGHSPVFTFQELLRRVSKQTQFFVNQILPRNPTHEDVRDNFVGSEKDRHYMSGVNLSTIAQGIIHPLRDISDVPGKTWRSFLALLCIDAVGGDSNRFQHILAFAEVLHVGSLVIDDIEDNSHTRRGVPTIHRVYGNAVAINAGTMAYFVTIQWLLKKTPGVTEAQKIYVYEKYFSCLRAAHCGQALDIHGLDYLMPDAIRTRDADSVLENAIIAIHRLKTAVPVSTMAQVGGFIGGGTLKQVEGLGRYFERIGIAFQIIDDVLNLTGTLGKTLGEDITSGKVTYPVARAMKLIENEADRNWIWTTLASKPDDQKIVHEVIGKLTECGAVDACIEEAAKMVENGWKDLDPLIPESIYKVMIRAFGSYMLGPKF